MEVANVLSYDVTSGAGLQMSYVITSSPLQQTACSPGMLDAR